MERLRSLGLFILLLFCSDLFGQGKFYDRHNNSRHFIGVSSGVGRTSWFSKTEGYDIYDQQGSKVLSGDHELTAKTTHSVYQFDVLFPVSSFRMGIGITFEQSALYYMDVKSELSTKISFMESFRFDKFFLQAEFPTKLFNSGKFFLNVNGRVGYYGFSMVNSLSLFGEKRVGSTYYGSLGAMINTRIWPRVFVYLLPKFEYKYFKNDSYQDEGTIYHNLYSYGILGGVRFQML